MSVCPPTGSACRLNIEYPSRLDNGCFLRTFNLNTNLNEKSIMVPNPVRCPSEYRIRSPESYLLVSEPNASSTLARNGDQDTESVYISRAHIFSLA